jgi:hypothetical protein
MWKDVLSVRYSLPITFFVIATVASIIQRLTNFMSPTIHDTLGDTPTSDSIFVCLVSFDDSEIVRFVKYVRSRAKYPMRIAFGIVEYVVRSDASMANSVPESIRPCVQFYTKSLRTMQSTVFAQNLCVQQAFNRQKYICLMGACHLEDEWDVKLCNALPNERSILTIPLSERRMAMYTTCKSKKNKVKMTLRSMKQSPILAVPTLVCDSSFVFGEAVAMRKLLQGVYRVANPNDISAAFTMQAAELKYYLMCPTFLIAKKGEHPKPVLARRQEYTDDGLHDRLIEHLKLKDKQKRIYANVGLTLQPSDEECIAKHGSVAASRIALEEMRR